MIIQRAGIALSLACWASVAHAHGEEAVLFALGIALAILVVPFAIFLVFWRNIVKNKIILFCTYALSVVVAFYTAFSVIEILPNDYAFFGILFGLPFAVWLLGVRLLRSGATQQVAPGDAPKAARP